MTTALRGRPRRGRPVADPWRALWAMMVGFFMILVDATIVAVANPSIMDAAGRRLRRRDLGDQRLPAGYAVPLLVAGRLGDRYGPKNLYLIGLAVFTAASLWCGLSGTIGMLIAARVVQGVGAALLTPQTLSTITRIFPAERRGVAMSVWGATAGVATLVGPLAGGVLVDGLGWQWIFFVNVPIGIIGLGAGLLAGAGPADREARLRPDRRRAVRRRHVHGRLRPAGGAVARLGAVGLGHDRRADRRHGGVRLLAGRSTATSRWSRCGIFRDRDFSLSNIGVATIGFVVTAMILPVMFYAQAVCGLSPTRSALLTAPMAIATGVLAPCGRQARRPVSSAADRRVRLLDAGDRVDVVVGRDDRRPRRSGEWCCR